LLTAGASGAIFGLVGALIWYRLSSPLGYRIPWSPLLGMLGVNLAVGLSMPGLIDNWGHLGGLIGGFAAAAAIGVPPVPGLRPPRLSLGRRYHRWIAVALLLLTGTIVSGLVELPGAGRDLARAIKALEAGRPAEAEVGLQRAVLHQPAEPRLRWLLSWTYYAQGKCTAARREYDELRRLSPDFPAVEKLAEALRQCPP
jgi:rhomboid protease GluP